MRDIFNNTDDQDEAITAFLRVLVEGGANGMPVAEVVEKYVAPDYGISVMLECASCPGDHKKEWLSVQTVLTTVGAITLLRYMSALEKSR